MSRVIAPHVAKQLGISVEEAFARRHEDRKLWFDMGNHMRAADPGYLLRNVLEGGHSIVVGMRNVDELAFARARGIVDLFVWICRPIVPPDRTLEYGSCECDVVIWNDGTIQAFHAKLRSLANFAGLIVP
jgi:hypothetical protein